jgi:hypothetical protein
LLPLVPPGTLNDFASTAFKERVVMTRIEPAQAPDGFLADDNLMPDPAYSAIRTIFTAGPIGALMRWIDRRIEAREERLYGPATGSPSANQPGSPTVLDLDSQPDQDLAA